MKFNSVRWGLALGGALAAEAVVIAAAFAWVTIYSCLIHPGESLAVYQQYAEVASPWVSLTTGVPVFYLACRWIGSRSPVKSWPTAMGIFGFYLLVDAPVTLFAGNASLSPWFVVVNYILKLLACHFGGKSAAPNQVPQ